MHDFESFYSSEIKEYSIEELSKIVDETSKNHAYLYLTINEIRKLNNEDKRKLKQCPIYLYLDCPTQINRKELHYLNRMFNIQDIMVNGFSDTEIDLEKKKKIISIEPRILDLYLKGLENLTKGLKCNNKKETIESVIKLSNRIVSSIEYDETYGTKNYLDSYFTFNFSPSEVIAILENKTICRGYSGIFRDACNLMGIKAIKVTGYDLESRNAHSWNQVQISDNWYNLDLTWDQDNILHNNSIFLLTSDDDFNIACVTEDGHYISHIMYTILNEDRNNCESSIDKNLINSILEKRRVIKK